MTDEALLEEFGFDNESIEVGMDYKGSTINGKTGFPTPKRRYKAICSVFNQSIEENYFYTLEFLRVDQGFNDVKKITDLFTASEHSAFFGSAQQRLGLQQEKVSQFLATIGKMVKELFQLVRELRIIDERLGFYNDSYDVNSKSRVSAEITLKGIWIDLVEQGSKNPASVYGMSRELSFTTLPDLFFSLNPKHLKDVDADVDALDFNTKIKEVLKRKLRTYMQWKDATYDEILNRRVFTLKYLRQHFDIIKMYMHWVKPYLRNIRRLQLKDMSKSPDIIAAFEGSLMEIEYLCYKLPQGFKLGKDIISNHDVYSVALVHFSYRTTPHMSFQQEYQKGPVHVGKTDLTLRAYAWDKKQIDQYMQMKEKEEMDLLFAVDESVKAAMEALGAELERYLKEAGEVINLPKKGSDYGHGQHDDKHGHGKHDTHGKAGKSMVDPFTAVAKGFGEIFSAFGGGSGKARNGKDHGVGDGKHGKHHKQNKTVLDFEKKIAGKVASDCIYQLYKEYKKRNDMIHW